MELREKTNHINKQNISTGKNFELKVSGKAFDLLSSGIYSNKPLAIIRELACNAQDSHIEANNPEPIEIHVPNNLEPWLSVKDNGIGLSHNDVLNLYSTYFESTKQNTNDLTGTFGIGSKSPFAYTSKFTVISSFNKIKRTYICYIEEDNIQSRN